MTSSEVCLNRLAVKAGIAIASDGEAHSPLCPQGMGLADLRTSRGAFLFFLPWKGHTVVGTTDTKSPAQTSPGVSEDEIQYLLNEVGRYLSDDLQVRRWLGLGLGLGLGFGSGLGQP